MAGNKIMRWANGLYPRKHLNSKSFKLENSFLAIVLEWEVKKKKKLCHRWIFSVLPCGLLIWCCIHWVSVLPFPFVSLAVFSTSNPPFLTLVVFMLNKICWSPFKRRVLLLALDFCLSTTHNFFFLNYPSSLSPSPHPPSLRWGGILAGGSPEPASLLSLSSPLNQQSHRQGGR